MQKRGKETKGFCEKAVRPAVELGKVVCVLPLGLARVVLGETGGGWLNARTGELFELVERGARGIDRMVGRGR